MDGRTDKCVFQVCDTAAKKNGRTTARTDGHGLSKCSFDILRLQKKYKTKDSNGRTNGRTYGQAKNRPDRTKLTPGKPPNPPNPPNPPRPCQNLLFLLFPSFLVLSAAAFVFGATLALDDVFSPSYEASGTIGPSEEAASDAAIDGAAFLDDDAAVVVKIRGVDSAPDSRLMTPASAGVWEKQMKNAKNTIGILFSIILPGA